MPSPLKSSRSNTSYTVVIPHTPAAADIAGQSGRLRLLGIFIITTIYWL